MVFDLRRIRFEDPRFNGSPWLGLARVFAYLVREVGFPVVVCAVLWFDLRPQLQELVLTQKKILEVEAALAVRKCIPTGQDWIPSPQSNMAGKNPPRCYGISDGATDLSGGLSGARAARAPG